MQMNRSLIQKTKCNVQCMQCSVKLRVPLQPTRTKLNSAANALSLKQYAQLKVNERYHRVKCQICGNIKITFFLELSYSKERLQDITKTQSEYS